ncbi:MAG: hypothetical protein EZS26_002089 [Candidatus Ordinivivax streblomastigis]|uniref:Uncharacterized protein n=1 Tax=Candidatus Ordinivivax streblomastigis TaxID=2540710 RepID=A0A5M8P093_9BACT|nr:MAG: hypothetical protein EZS26_002089 [Candidatus Ordinivivax streblomastigis]
MSTIQSVLAIYALFSLLTLFQSGIRNVYIEILDSIYNRTFYSFRKGDMPKCFSKFYFTELSFDFLKLITFFILAPIIIIRHFSNGGFKYKFPHKPYWKVDISPIKEKYISTPITIKFKKDLPFTPDVKQVIYVESSYNEDLNRYIVKKHKDIDELFNENGFDFVYIPTIINELNTEKARYLFPQIDANTIVSNQITSQGIIDNLFTYTEDVIRLKGGLLHYQGTGDNFSFFTYYQFTNYKKSELWQQLRAYRSTLWADRREKLYCLSSSSDIPTEDTADDDFEYRAKNLIQEIEERIKALKQMGINELILKSMLSFDAEKPQLSRLQITKNYEIRLPDYNNLEISMYPLPKAVFFLFLKHPEGILFKHLSEHRDELTEIYKRISGKESVAEISKSMNDIVDSTKNAINEKCSRIREAFIKEFDESIARNYFITGKKGMPKKIILDRSLVLLEGNV